MVQRPETDIVRKHNSASAPTVAEFGMKDRKAKTMGLSTLALTPNSDKGKVRLSLNAPRQLDHFVPVHGTAYQWFGS